MAIDNKASSLLADRLGAPVTGLPGLKLAEAETLLSALDAAKARQRAALQASTEAALGHVPMLLRGAVRKILFG